MTDYQKIDWTKLPELPWNLELYFLDSGIPSIRWVGTHSPVAMRDGEDKDPWRYLGGHRGELLHAFVATDTIDRFIADQEAELAKPKPRRVTPRELLVELIQTCSVVKISATNQQNQRLVALRWSSYGLQGQWSDKAPGDWSEIDLEWFQSHKHIEVDPVPQKPRLPVKTKAPEGYAWEFDRHGNVVLRKAGTESTWGLVERSIREDIRGRAIREIAIVDASEELNP